MSGYIVKSTLFCPPCEGNSNRISHLLFSHVRNALNVSRKRERAILVRRYTGKC